MVIGRALGYGVQPHGSEAEAGAIDKALAVAAWPHAGISPDALRALANSGIYFAPGGGPRQGRRKAFFMRSVKNAVVSTRSGRATPDKLAKYSRDAILIQRK